MTKVSVLIPCYNAGDFIQDAVSSVLDQGDSVGEILVYDDASDEESKHILEKLEKSNDLIKVHYSGENKGAGIARAHLISWAQYEYSAFLDADDVWMPNKLKIQLDKFSDPEVLICYSSFLICDEQLTPHHIKTSLPRIDCRTLLFANHIPNSTAVFKTDAAKTINYPKLRRRQDYAFWLKLLTNYPQSVAVGVKEPLMKYRQVKNSLSSSPVQNLRYNYRLFRQELGLNPISSATYVACNIYNRFLNNRLTKL